MYMLSHNASYEDIQYEFKHSGETIHRHIKSIFKIIPNLTCRFVKPTVATETHWKISTDPRFYPYFKVNHLRHSTYQPYTHLSLYIANIHTSLFQNCLGAIDGTHIPITISQDKQAPYGNRKGTLSQNIMLACDFDLNFTFISSGWESSATDARVLRSALLRGFRVPEGKFSLLMVATLTLHHSLLLIVV